MSKYFHLTIKEIVEETPDTKTFYFWQPIHQAVAYEAGQFLTLIVSVNGQKHRRSYSMSSSPREGTLAVTVKRVKNGIVSNYLCDQAKVGDALEVMEPMGHFTAKIDQNASRNLVFFAGGSGITPIFSIIKTVLAAEPQSRLFLVYGSRSEEYIIFKKQLSALEDKYPNQLKVIHVLTQPNYTWTGYKTRINQASAVIFLKQDIALPIEKSDYYLCGPEGMMQQVETALQLFNVPESQIHKEQFGSTHSTETEDIEENTDEGLKDQEVTLTYEGETYTLLVKAHETILEAALNQDIDLPYSCQAGMCTACMGKCTAGQVRMDEEDGLTDNEVKQGYVLTCVAHPVGKGVVIEIE